MPGKPVFVFAPLIKALREKSRTRKPFTRFAFIGKRRLPDNTWEKVTFPDVVLSKIKSFGFEHELIYTQAGNPREYERWGYVLLNSGAHYRVSVPMIRELQENLGLRCRIDRKEDLQAVLSTGKTITAIDWHMSIIEPNQPTTKS